MRGPIMVLLSMSYLLFGVCSSRSAERLLDKEDKDEAGLAVTVKLLQEQMSALLDHRQEDYNALEESLRQSIEKNTELHLLKNELNQLRKEMVLMRSSSPSLTSSSQTEKTTFEPSNESKNERLRLRWLAEAVSELQAELGEVLKSRDSSEAHEERARLRAEVELLRADVVGLDRGVRDLGAQVAKLQDGLQTATLDLASSRDSTNRLTDNINQLSEQISSVQDEIKFIKSEKHHGNKDSYVLDNEITSLEEEIKKKTTHLPRHIFSRLPSTLRHLDDRMNKLEHKIIKVSRKRALLEKRVVFEDHENMAKRVHILESIGRDLTEKIRNVSKEVELSARFSDSVDQMFESLGNLEEMIIVNQSESKREIARLDVNAAKKSTELSLTREELGNIKKTVQALSVSASKLQEKSDAHEGQLTRLNQTLGQLNLGSSIVKAENVTKELEHVEDEYRKMVDALPGNCNEKDGLTLLAPGPGAPLLAACRKGWIVVGRRVDGTVNFDRTWNDYAQGFGSPINEFWAGNEALHRLSRDNCTRLRIELNDIDGNYWVANYEDFSVGSEETGYRLRVSGYSGNATDAMSYQNNMSFSAKDRDMDISSTDCAANYHGGWWFSHCQHANLNGRYSLGLTWYRSDSNQWMAVASTELSVQRKQQCL